MANWERMSRLAYRGRYLFCSVQKLDDPDGNWLRNFQAEASEHSAQVVVENGLLYVEFDNA